MKKRLFAVILIGITIILFAIGIGSVFIDPADIIRVILNKLFGLNIDGIDPRNVSIIINLRLPRVLLAFLVGAAVSVSGAIVQSVLKNPLASPYTLGVSSGASLGASLVIITGFTVPILGKFTLPMAGLTFGLITVILAVLFAQKVDMNMSTNTIILAGMVFSLFMNAILTLISGLFRHKMQQILLWQMGTFGMKGWDYVIMLLPIVIAGVIVCMFYVRELDILSFGEEQAQAIGVDTKKVKWILLGLASILTGVAVSFAGVIGFIDLIAPHIVRRIFGSKHKYLIPISAIFGGIFMVFCDLIARTIVSPSELPVGAVTALIGSPFFAYVYFGGKKTKWKK